MRHPTAHNDQGLLDFNREHGWYDEDEYEAEVRTEAEMRSGSLPGKSAKR